MGGAFRDSVSGYATGCYYRGDDVRDYQSTIDELAAEAASYVEAGFRTLKIKIGLLPIPDDARRVATIREAVGPDTALLVDCNHAYHASMQSVWVECSRNTAA